MWNKYIIDVLANKNYFNYFIWFAYVIIILYLIFLSKIIQTF